MEEIVKNEFEFYSRLAKPLVLNMPQPKDRILAAAWIKKFRDPGQGTEKLRTIYLKLLLFCLQRRKLSGIFVDDPAEYDTLEELPPDIDLNEFARNLLEQEAAERREKIRLEMMGDMDIFPAFITDCSPDLTEYVAAQDIPNFGVHAYYAISKQPINKWQQSDKAVFPKGTRSAIDTSVSAAAAGAASTCVCAPKGTSSAPEVEETTEEGDLPSCRKKPEPSSPEKRKRRPKKLGTSPPSHPIGEVKHPTEERITPTWGTNLIEIREHTDLGNIEEPTDAEKALEEEASQMMQEEEEEEEEVPEEENVIASRADEMLHMIDEFKHGKMDKSKTPVKSEARGSKSPKSPKKMPKKLKKGKEKAGVSTKPANLPDEFKDWTERDLQMGGLTWDDLMSLGGATGSWKVGDELDLDAMLREAEADLAAAKTMYDEGVEEDEPVIELLDDELAELEEQINALKEAEESQAASPAITSGIPITTPNASASPRRFRSPERVFAGEDDDLLEHRLSPLRPPKETQQSVTPKRQKPPPEQTDLDPNISRVYEQAQKAIKQQQEGFEDEQDEFERLEQQFEQEERRSPLPSTSRRSGGSPSTPGPEERMRSVRDRARQQERLLRTPDPEYDRFAEEFEGADADLGSPCGLCGSPPRMTEDEEFEMMEQLFQHQQEQPSMLSGSYSPHSSFSPDLSQGLDDMHLSPQGYLSEDSEGSFGLLAPDTSQPSPGLSEEYYHRAAMEQRGRQAREAAMYQEALLRQGSPQANQIIDEAERSFEEDIFKKAGGGQQQLFAESPPAAFSSPTRFPPTPPRSPAPRTPRMDVQPDDLGVEWLDESDDIGILHEMEDDFDPGQIYDEGTDIFERFGGLPGENAYPDQQAALISPLKTSTCPGAASVSRSPARTPTPRPVSRTPSPQRSPRQPPTPPAMPFFPGITAPITPPPQYPVPRAKWYTTPPPPPIYGPEGRPSGYMSPPMAPYGPQERPQFYHTPETVKYDDFFSPDPFMDTGIDDVDMPDFGELPPETPDPCTPCGSMQMASPKPESGRRVARLRPPAPVSPPRPAPRPKSQSPVRPPIKMRPKKLFGEGLEAPDSSYEQAQEAAPERKRRRHRSKSRHKRSKKMSPGDDFEEMERRFQMEDTQAPCGTCGGAPEMPFSPGEAARVRQRAQQQEDLLRTPPTPEDDFEEMERRFQMEDTRAPCGTCGGAPEMPFSPGEAHRVRQRAQQQEDLLRTPPTPEDDEFERLEREFQMEEGSHPYVAGLRTPDQAAAARVQEIARRQHEELLMKSSPRTPVRAPRFGTPTCAGAQRSRRDLDRRKVITPPPQTQRTPPRQPSPTWSTPIGVAGPSRRPTGLTPPVYDSDFSPPPSPPKTPKFAPAKRIKKRGKYPPPPPSPKTPTDRRIIPSPCMAPPQRVPLGGGERTPIRRAPSMQRRRIFEEPGRTPRLPARESPIKYSPFTSPCPGAAPESYLELEPFIGDTTPPEHMSPPPPPTLRDDQMYYPPEILPCGTPEALPTMEELRKHRFVPDTAHMRISHQTPFGRGPGPMSHRESVSAFTQMDRIHEYGSDDEWRKHLLNEADLETYQKYYDRPVSSFPEKRTPKHQTFYPRKFKSPKICPMSPPLELSDDGDIVGEIMKANLRVPPERFPPPKHSLRPTAKPCTGTAGGLGTFDIQRHDAFMEAVRAGTLEDHLGQQHFEDIADQADLMFNYEGGLLNISPPPGDELNRNYYPDIEAATDRLIESILKYDLPESPESSPCGPATCGDPSRTRPTAPCGPPRVPTAETPRASPARAPPAAGPCQGATGAIPKTKRPLEKKMPKKQLRETRSSQLRKENLAKQQEAEKQAKIQREKAEEKKKKFHIKKREEILARRRALEEEKRARPPLEIPGGRMRPVDYRGAGGSGRVISKSAQKDMPQQVEDHEDAVACRQLFEGERTPSSSRRRGKKKKGRKGSGSCGVCESIDDLATPLEGPDFLEELREHDIRFPGYQRGIVIKGRYKPMRRRSATAFQQMDYIEEGDEPVQELRSRAARPREYQPARSPVIAEVDRIQQIMAQGGISEDDELAEFEELERQLGAAPQVRSPAAILEDEELAEFEELERQMECEEECGGAGQSQVQPSFAQGITYSPPRPRPTFGAPPYRISPQHLPIQQPSPCSPPPPSPPSSPPFQPEEGYYLDSVQPPVFYDMEEEDRLPFAAGLPPDESYLDTVMPPVFDDMEEEDRLPCYVNVPPPPSPPLAPASVRQEVASMAKSHFDPGLRGDILPREQRRVVRGPCSLGEVQEEEPLIPHLVGAEPFREDRETRRRRRKDRQQRRRPRREDDFSRYIASIEQQSGLSPVQSPEYNVMDETPPSDLESPMRPYLPQSPLRSSIPPFHLPPVTQPPPSSMFPFSPPCQPQLYTGELPIHPDLVELAQYEPPLEITEGICQLSDEQPGEDLYFTPPRYPEMEMELDRQAMLRYQSPNISGDDWLESPYEPAMQTPPSVGRGPCGTYTPSATPPLGLLDPSLFDRSDDAMLLTPPAGSGQQDLQEFFTRSPPLVQTPPSVGRRPCGTYTPTATPPLGLLDPSLLDRSDDAMLLTPPADSHQQDLQEFFTRTPPLEAVTSIQELRYRTQRAQGRRGIRPQAQYFGGYGEAPSRPVPRWYNIGGARNVIREVEEPVSPPTPGTPPPQLPEPSSRWSPTLDEFERLEREAQREDRRGKKPSRRVQRRLDFDTIERQATLQEMGEEAERVFMEYGRPPSPRMERMPSPSRTPPYRYFDPYDDPGRDMADYLIDQGNEDFLAGYESPEPLSKSWEAQMAGRCPGSPVVLPIMDDAGVENRLLEEMGYFPELLPPVESTSPQMLDEIEMDELEGYRTPPQLSPVRTPPHIARQRAERQRARQEAEEAWRREEDERELQELRQTFGPSPGPPSPGPDDDFLESVYGHQVPAPFRAGRRTSCYIRDQIGSREINMRLSRKSRPPDLQTIKEPRRPPAAPTGAQPRGAPSRAQVVPTSSAQRVAEARRQYQQTSRSGGQRPGRVPPQQNVEECGPDASCQAPRPQYSVEEAQMRARERMRARRRQEAAGPPVRATREVRQAPPPPPPPSQPSTSFMPRQVQMQMRRAAPQPELQDLEEFMRGGPRAGDGPQPRARSCRAGQGRPARAEQPQGTDPRRRVTKTCSQKRIVTKQN